MRCRLTPVTILVGASALSFVLGLSSSLWLRALLPQLAVTRAYHRDARLCARSPAVEFDPATWDPPAEDPWGRPWRVVHATAWSGVVYYPVFSLGPDGRDDGGVGDDLWPLSDRGLAPFKSSDPPSWPVLYLDLLLMLGVPGALWWPWSLARVWASPRQPLGREASLCVVVASVPSVGLGWQLLTLPAPISQPWSVVDPGLALAMTGALGIVLATAGLRSWRWTRTSPSP